MQSHPASVGATSTDALDAVAAAFDFAAQQLTVPGQRRSRVGALSAIVAALADARGRLAGDEAVIGDLDRARAALSRAMETAAEDEPLAALGPALERARGLAVERAARAPVELVEPSRAPMVTSDGTPALHRDVRVEAAPRPVAPRAFGAVPSLPVASPAPSTRAQSALRRWARNALEEIGIAGRLRRPDEDEAWTSGRSFEARALVFLDALASLGRGGSEDERLDVASVVEEALHELTIPDPARVFAALFSLGCLHGQGAAARLHVHARSVQPGVSDAVEDALALGSSPLVDDVVLALLCEDDQPELLVRGLRVGRRRRRIPQRLALDLLSHPAPRVATAAAQACGVLGPELARGPLEDALLGPAESAVSAAEALASLGVPPLSWGRRIAALGDAPDGVSVRAARLRVLTAWARDVEPLLEVCAGFSRATQVDLLGWLGSPLALDTLRDALDDPDWSVRDRAAWSLARITGAGLDGLGNIEVDAHGNPTPDPDASPGLASSYTRRRPPIDPAFWGGPIERARAVDAPRLRAGAPLGPGAVLDELAEPKTRQGSRRILVTELALLSRGKALLPLDLDDWIARQEHILSLAVPQVRPT